MKLFQFPIPLTAMLAPLGILELLKQIVITFTIIKFLKVKLDSEF